jgi:hypothetical protein
MYYVVEYKGPFGFIKSWTSVRDGEMYSQPYLTPSIVEGMRQKLEVSTILRHRIRYKGISLQQEQTQPASWEATKQVAKRPRSILKRGVLIQPTLTLAFETIEDAIKASEQHLCLCRNEDILLPFGNPKQITQEEFDSLWGIELIFDKVEDSFLVGFNRFQDGAEMYGHLCIVGNPVSIEGEI